MMSDCGEVDDENNLNIIDTITVFKYLNNVSENTCEHTEELVVDEDNDLVVPRKMSIESILKIEHSTYTDVDNVGLQVWNGAVLLSEFILSQGHTFLNKHVFEMGSGTGFVSIIAAKYCSSVTCTDLDNKIILNMIDRNFERNRSCITANYRILPFDFSKEWTLNIKTAINNTDIIIASELIYDDDISEALVKTLIKILRDRKNIVIYLSVERRYVFTLSNKKVECKHYNYFFSLLTNAFEDLLLQYKLNQIPATDVPKYFYEYERCNETELWYISVDT